MKILLGYCGILTLIFSLGLTRGWRVFWVNDRKLLLWFAFTDVLIEEDRISRVQKGKEYEDTHISGIGNALPGN